MKLSLTDKHCEKATSKGKPQLDIRDAVTPGLVLRVTKAGKKSWVFGRSRVPLGTYPATSLIEARGRATEAQGMIEAGVDPRAARLAAEVSKPTVAQLVDDRIRLEARADSDNFLWTCMEIERCYDHDVIPLVGDVAVVDFRPAHLNKITNAIKDRGANTQANRTYQLVVALFEFAVRRGEYGIDLNPLASCVPPSKEQIKERVLSPAELRTFWSDVDAAMERSDLIPDLLRLILVTGQRPGEECGTIQREEIDLGAKLWTIPAHKTKNKKGAHAVPLNDLAVEILRRRMKLTNGSFLFPNREGEGAVPNYLISQTLRRALKDGRLKIAHFTPHDLRRTFATLASENLKQENGEPIHELYISHVLNHKSVTKKGVTARVYNHNQYLPEKRECLDKWGRFLADLLGLEMGLKAVA